MSIPQEEELTGWLADVIAKARHGPGVDMGGKHMPRPTERQAARMFVEDHFRPLLERVRGLEEVAKRAAIAYYELFDDDEFPKASLHRGEHGYIMWQSAVCQLLSDLRESALSALGGQQVGKPRP